ncbi:Tubulin--tyrosine ligase-like protein 12 [Hondaea fermentalgiana]|uniref:Tubulin--tyrosine ligase-like protein 12 n=1 Tax=Hondaea fermentalgiana TaxID=2315210 RepID=A0A2R5GJJ2_9STRA|nr:Tubulin--tyrosine ligase-like protein 12 [Hondaea fermentalgiana]|eukprot:GBG30489.1 Tubulin--tyrosine ligase-like protein 12 [Hondaea fermentalgiana]
MDRVREAIKAQTLDQEAIARVLDDGAEMALLYGETPLESVSDALEIVRTAPSATGAKGQALLGDGSEVFVDVGSGRGHVVLAAAASMKWKRCVGIELEQAHVDEANKALEVLRTQTANENDDTEGVGALQTPPSAIEFICANALDSEAAHEALAGAKLVYCFDLAFSAQVRCHLAALFAKVMPSNALLVSGHSDPVPSVDFAPLLPLQTIKMEWGPAPLRVYRKASGAFDLWLEQHLPQLEAAGVPAALHKAAFRKITEMDFDIGAAVQLARESEDSEDLVVVATKSLGPADAQQETEYGEGAVFILDHAWTFGSRADAAASLASVPGLVDRLWALCGEQAGEKAKPDAALLQEDPEEAAKRVLDAAGNLLASYEVRRGDADGTAGTTVFYMLDEVGSRLRRRQRGSAARLQPTEANFRLAPIYSFDYRMAFQLAWVIAPVEKGSVLVADHEQGWDVHHEIDIAAASEQSAEALPEMKEFAAQASLRQMMDASRASGTSESAE